MTGFHSRNIFCTIINTKAEKKLQVWMQMFLAIPSLSSCVIVFWNTAQVHIALFCYKAIADIN